MKEAVRAIADAVLYEGFLLFPYGKSALKNQMPFQFGVVMPDGYADPSEPSYFRSQFVVCGTPAIGGVLRFLQIKGDPVEREVPFSFQLDGVPVDLPFEIDGLRGVIALASAAADDARCITLEVRNRTVADAQGTRNEALRSAFVSAHVVLETAKGAFVSMLDPPDELKAAVARCENERFFPVLVGEESPGKQTATQLLVSPIILYDFPRIAEHSRARTFDGTEIDELLMLSVASLSQEEKRDARAAHPYVRELVDKAEALDANTQKSLHGEVHIDGIAIRPGSRVRVNPKGRADVWDDLVRGMTARVSVIHADLEGKRYVGVLFDADPASDMHEWYGRSFFYGVDEVELLP